MPLLEPDQRPRSIRERGRWFYRATVLTLCAAFLFWNAKKISDPSWRASSFSFLVKYTEGWDPFWRGASSAILGSWFAVFGLIALWAAIRPFTPATRRSLNEDDPG